MTMVRRNPPTRGLAVGPTTALDHEIMAQLADGHPRRPVEIAQAIGGVSANRVHTRLKVLLQRQLIERQRSTTIRNGPGASSYRKVPDGVPDP